MTSNLQSHISQLQVIKKKKNQHNKNLYKWYNLFYFSCKNENIGETKKKRKDNGRWNYHIVIKGKIRKKCVFLI